MSAEPYVPARARLSGLREAVQSCRGCGLYRDATQAVFGSGRESARLMLIGEQPGDQEDRQGEPFTGPAGGLLNRALERAGIDRADAYVTNATKHFKFSRRQGKRRIHQKPSRSEVLACRPWLDAELRLVAPELVVLLGATAAQALLGTSFRITRSRGELIDLPESARVAPHGGPARGLATAHPSAVLRADDRDAELNDLVSDLQVAAGALR